MDLYAMVHSFHLLLDEWDPRKKNSTLQGIQIGGPFVPHVFFLAMEPLHRLFQKCQQVGLISNLSRACDSFRASLYADDAAVFIKPTQKELHVTKCILDIFAQASGLVTNLAKTDFPY
jgi:hypothetical protein